MAIAAPANAVAGVLPQQPGLAAALGQVRRIKNDQGPSSEYMSGLFN